VLQPALLQPPRLRDGALRRPRLTRRLRHGRQRLTLIVAPAGWGKSSLLADWAADDDRDFAWVTVEPAAGDPAATWTHVAAALAAVVDPEGIPDGWLALAEGDDPAGALAREIGLAGPGIVLVLDALPSGAGPDAVDPALLRFVELAPPRVSVAIASRAEPRLPVARLRAAGELLELRTADLAFDPPEAAAFLATQVEGKVSQDAVRVLCARTEGWPALLALAAASLNAARDSAAFLATFGASNRHVADYLTEQIVAPLDTDARELLRLASVVDTICGALADALADEGAGADGAGRLAALERANVPIAPLDDRREWYRLHGLLGELLRGELARSSPDRLAILERRAAAWFAGAGDPERAVRHAIAAPDVELAASVIGATYLEQLEQGRLATVVGWLDALGVAAVESDRRLAVVRAWTMHFLGRHAEGNAALDAAVRAPTVGPMPDGAGSIEATVALVGAAFPGNDAAEMLAAARRAFELEANRQSPWTVTVHVLLGFGLVRMGQFAEARDHLRMGAELALAGGMWMDAIGARALLGRVALETGDSDLAEREARAAL